MVRYQAKQKGKGVPSSSNEIYKIMIGVENLKSTLEQYFDVAKENEKDRDMAILIKDIRH